MGPTRSRIALLDSAAEVQGCQQGPFAAHEAAGHFIDGENRGDGQAAFDGFDDAVMVVDVDFVAGFDEDDLGAHAFGLGDDGAGFDAEGFGLIAGRDADGGVGHHGDDGDGTAAQFGADLLLDGGEIGVEIDEEPVEAGAGGRILRWRKRLRCGNLALYWPRILKHGGSRIRFRYGRSCHSTLFSPFVPYYARAFRNI